MDRSLRTHSVALGIVLAATSVVSLEARAEYESYFNEPIIHSTTAGLQVGLRPLDVGTNPAFEYLIQQVCVDAQDRPIPKDPLTCPTSRRKLRLGEDLPYSRLSLTGDGRIAAVEDSLPILFNDRVRAVNSRVGVTARDGSKLRHYMTGDGYDVVDNLGGYTFVYGTRDPNTTNENYIWCGMFGQEGGGWILFPDGATGYNSGIFQIGGGTYGACNPTNQTLTEMAPVTMSFTAGKVLSAMKAVHYGGSGFAADHLEVFYQSKIYGAVRWERWEPNAPALEALNQCNGANVMTRGPGGPGMTYYRKDCRDWSHIKLHTRPLHAYHIPLSGTFTSSPSLIGNGDFGSGEASQWTPVTNGEMTYQVAVDTADSDNRYLVMQKTASTMTSSIYQTSTPRTVYVNSVIQGGALMKGPVNKQAVIEVSITTPRGTTVEKIRVLMPNNGNANGISNWTPIRFSIPYQFQPFESVQMQFRVYLKSTGWHALDEPFLAVLPETIGTYGWPGTGVVLPNPWK